MNEKTKILFWNARSIVKKKEELIKISHNIDICLIVESWLTDKQPNFNLPGFKTVRDDHLSARGGGGILILLRNYLAFKKRSDLVSPDISVELTGVTITNVKPKLELIACYRAPELSLTETQWEDILNNVKDNSHTLLVGDFNAHHISWNSKTMIVTGLIYTTAIYLTISFYITELHQPTYNLTKHTNLTST